MLALVFFVVSIIDIALVRTLSIQIGLAVFFNYLLQVLSLSAATIIDWRRSTVQIT
jgi:hypothetical protein